MIDSWKELLLARSVQAAIRNGDVARFDELMAKAERPFDVLKHRDEESRSVMHLAALGGSVQIQAALLDSQWLRVNTGDKMYNSPLHLAIYSKNYRIAVSSIGH